MAWIEPKTDWVDTDFFNYSDYNRIVGNISEIKSLLHDMFPDFGFGVMNYPKDYTSMFYASEMNTIENNLHALNSNSYELNIGNKQSYKINGATPDYEEWNRIENALLTLHEKIVAQLEEDTSPTIEITSNTSDWTSNSSYTITGKLTANGNGIGGARIVGLSKNITINNDGTFSEARTLGNGANSYTIKAWDEDGNPSFTSFVIRYDPTLPVITVTSAMGTWNTSTSYTVRGIATDPESGIASVSVNGTTVAVAADGTFSRTITLTGTSNNVNVTAVNGAGRSNHTSFIAYYDTVAPSLTVDSPTGTSSSSPTYTRNSSYTINGTVSDSGSGVSRVTVNGHTATLSGNNYSYTLTGLSSSSTTTVTVIAYDKASNSTSRTRYLRYDATAPVITVTSSLANTVSKSYTITGTVTDTGSGVASLTINGYSTTVTNGSFSKTFTLGEGTSTFTLVAKDKAGNSTTKTVTKKCVNQSTNNNYNWSNYTYKGDTSYNHGVYAVIGGATTKLKDVAHGTSDSYTDPSVRFDHSHFLLPKGISIVSVVAGGNGTGQSGAYTRLDLYDAHTGQTLQTVSVDGAGRSVNLYATVTQEQSMHDLYVMLDSSAHGYTYAYGDAWSGIYDWEFTFYQ